MTACLRKMTRAHPQPKSMLFGRLPSCVQLQGIGSSARILQGDLAACGPSVIHVIDQARRCGAIC